MTVDYDAPRRASVETEQESLDDLAGFTRFCFREDYAIDEKTREGRNGERNGERREGGRDGHRDGGRGQEQRGDPRFDNRGDGQGRPTGQIWG